MALKMPRVGELDCRRIDTEAALLGEASLTSSQSKRSGAVRLRSYRVTSNSIELVPGVR